MRVLRGNDILINWSVFYDAGGVKTNVDFSNSTLSVFILDSYGKRAVEHTVSGNVISIHYGGEIQRLGTIAIDAYWQNNNTLVWSRAKKNEVVELVDNPESVTLDGIPTDISITTINTSSDTFFGGTYNANFSNYYTKEEIDNKIISDYNFLSNKPLIYDEATGKYTAVDAPINFVNNINIGNFVAGVSGINFTANGNGEVGTLTVRDRLIVNGVEITGSGTGGLDVTNMWNVLGSADDSDKQINVVHLTDALSGYLQTSIFDDLFEKVNIGTLETPKYAIKAKYDFYSIGEVSAFGAGSSGGSGGGLIQTVYGISGLSTVHSDSNLTETFNAAAIKKIYDDVVNLQNGSLVNYSLTGTGNAITGVSKSGSSLNFVKGSTFSLNGHTHSFGDISGLPTTLGGYGITDGVTTTVFNTLVNDFNTHITSDSHLTATQKNILAHLQIVEGKLQADIDFYSTGEVSAFGAGSGSSSGGGLIQTVYGYSSLGSAFNNTTLTDTFNAYTINQLHARLSQVEVGAAVNVAVSGAGNAITGVTKNGNVLEFTKGLTFSLANHTHDYIPLSQKGTANGVASLDANGLIISAQLPSYVDDVIEVSSYANLPVSGESGKIYVTTDTNITYRWTGTTYVEISKSIALGETSSTAYRGDLGAIAYAHSQIAGGTGVHISGTERTNWNIAYTNSHIHANKSLLDDFNQSDNDVLNHLSIVDGKLKVDIDLYSLGEVSAFGAGSGTGGSGLIQTVYGLSGLGGTYSDATLTDTFNAYTINKINTDLSARIASLESGSALTFTTTGTGNAVTSITKSGTNVTVTKGLTFSVDGHTHSYLPLSGGQLTGQLVLLQGAGGGISFPDNSFGGGGDSASIKLLNPAGGESTEMTFTITNDVDDIINFSVPSIDGVKVNRYTVWNAGNFTNLNQLTTRNFSDLQNKPTTLSGYGITDAYTTSSADNTFLKKSGGTMSGNLTIGNSVIYSGGSDGGINSALFGNDCFIGDCNVSNVLGLKGSQNNYYGGLQLGTQGGVLGYFGNGLTYNGNTVWHSGNDGSGSGLDADLLDGTHLKSIIGYDTKRDFINGTLITTDIDYSGTDGDPFYLEIKGNTYGRWYPCLTQAQGYIYDDRIINYGVTHLGYVGIVGLVALNVNGRLCFWFPRQPYWEGYSIFVSSAYSTSYNRVIAVDDVAKPAGTKEVNISEHTSTSAFLDSNVASATKLQTARSIWGQNFNGEGNVSGALNGATTGTFSSSISATTGIFSNLTANYLPKHTAGGLSNSLIYDNGTYVGIGTTSPINKLDVVSTVSAQGISITNNSGGFANFDVIGNRNTAGIAIGGIRMRHTSDTYSLFELITFSDYTGVGFFTGDNTGDATLKMKLFTNGNLAISTATDSGYKLDVNGTLRAASTLSVKGTTAFDSLARLNITNGSADYGRAQLRITGRLQANNDAWSMNGRNNIIFGVNANESNVGIGVDGVDKMAIQYQMVTNQLGIVSEYSPASPIARISQNGAATFNSLGIANTSNSSGKGLSLFDGATDGKPTYGLFFGGTSTFGTHGGVSENWATYFTMGGPENRGWIFQSDYGNAASISAGGNAKFNGILRVDSYISTGEGADDAYGWINVTRSASIENASYFSMVRSGNAAMGFGINTNNAILIGGAGASKTIVDTYLSLHADHVTTTKPFSSSNRIFTGYDSGQANSISCSGWFRSNGTSGWVNNTYGGGINMTDSTYVRVYNNKAFWVDNNIVATGEITAFGASDIRLKSNIKQIDSALDFLGKVKTYEFDWNEKAIALNPLKTKRGTGVIAQEMSLLDNNFVHSIYGDYLGVDYERFIPYLIGGVNEVADEVTILKKRVAELELEIKQLKK